MGTPVGRPEDVKPKELTTTLEELFAAARQNSPMLGRDQKMIERSQLAVNVARKEYYPDVTVNAGYYNMGSMPPMYEVRADVKVPIWISFVLALLFFWVRVQPPTVIRIAANGDATVVRVPVPKV